MLKLHNSLLRSDSMKSISDKLMGSSDVYGIYNFSSLKKQYKNIFVRFDKYINKIGIFSLPIKKYRESNNIICGYITKNEDKKKLNDIFKKFIFEKHKRVYLRGSGYYYWLPQYIFRDNRTMYVKWKSLFNNSYESLNLIYRYRLLSFWSKFSTEEQLLILCLIDHYKNSIFYAMNNIYHLSLNDNIRHSNSIISNLNILAQECTDLYYGLVFNKPKKDSIIHMLIYGKKGNIVSMMKKYQIKQQGMRELDDPHIIFLSVLSLLKQIGINRKKYDLVVDFPCGGTELGLAFTSIFKLLYKNKKPPEVIHCLYSSKKIQRDPAVAIKKETVHWLFNFIPKYYHKILKEQIKKKVNVLLYDNNVTTFGTLADVKSFFNNVYKITADAAVAAVYYDNMAKFLIGRKSEPLVYNWKKVLDYKPVTDYITAFNTWGTSMKGRIIENIYSKQKGLKII